MDVVNGQKVQTADVKTTSCILKIQIQVSLGNICRLANFQLRFKGKRSLHFSKTNDNNNTSNTTMLRLIAFFLQTLV